MTPRFERPLFRTLHAIKNSMPSRTPLHLQARLLTSKTRIRLPITQNLHDYASPCLSPSYYDHHPQSIPSQAGNSEAGNPIRSKNRHIPVPDPKQGNIPHPYSDQRLCDAYTYIYIHLLENRFGEREDRLPNRRNKATSVTTFTSYPWGSKL